MIALYFCLEQVVFIFAAWTLGYHLCLLTGWPAPAAFAAAVPLYAVLCAFIGRSPRRALASARRERGFLSAVAAVGIVLALVTLVFYRSDADDVSFFHRALVQLDAPGAPFITENTQLNARGLPCISMMHLMTSYEPLAAFLGEALTGNALWFYQNATAAFAAILFAMVYALTFRTLRFSPARAVTGACLSAAFLLLDGGIHRSFGNMGFVKLWQGKTILITVGLPMILLLSVRFLSMPSRRRLAVLFLAGVCALGLSGSAIFLVPVLVFAAAAAYCVSFGAARGRLGKAAVLNLGSVYCAGIGVLILLGVIPQPQDTQVWQEWWPSTWWTSLLFVMEGARVVTRNGIILFLVPLALLGPLRRRYMAALSLVLIAIFANPVTGPVMMRIVKPGAFWRLAFLFPIPLCFGLLAAAFSRRSRWPGFAVHGTVVAAAVLAVACALSATVFKEAHAKTPRELKLPPREYAFCKASDAKVARGAVILAPEGVMWVMGLLRPDVRFEACRALETLHTFRCIGQPAEGEMRVAAQKAVSGAPLDSKTKDAFLHCMKHDIQYIVTKRQSAGPLAALLASKGRQAEITLETDGYSLISVR